MGVKEKDFNRLMANNNFVNKGKRILPDSKLIKLSGNSIAIPVLEAIFKQVVELEELFEHSTNKIHC